MAPTRAAESDRGSDADDVSGSDRGGESCCQSSELGNIAGGIFVFGNRKLDRFKNVFLNKSGPYSHEKMCSEKQDDQWPSPKK